MTNLEQNRRLKKDRREHGKNIDGINIICSDNCYGTFIRMFLYCKSGCLATINKGSRYTLLTHGSFTTDNLALIMDYIEFYFYYPMLIPTDPLHRLRCFDKFNELCAIMSNIYSNTKKQVCIKHLEYTIENKIAPEFNESKLLFTDLFIVSLIIEVEKRYKNLYFSKYKVQRYLRSLFSMNVVCNYMRYSQSQQSVE